MSIISCLPTGKYDYTLFPLTEEIITIDEEGNDNVKVVLADGIIEVDDQDLQQIRVTKKFADDLSTIVNMSEIEVGEEKRERDRLAALVQPDPITARLDRLEAEIGRLAQLLDSRRVA